MRGIHRMIPAGGTHRRKGVMVLNEFNDQLEVNLDGEIIACSWSDAVQVFEGDTVLVDLISGPRGQAEAIVISRLASKPRPGWGVVTVVPGGGSPTITVEGPDITSYQCYYVLSYTPAVSDIVALQWVGGRGLVVGELPDGIEPDPATSNIEPVPVEQAEGDPTDGETSYSACNSATYQISSGLWNEFRFGGGHVYQSTDLVGAWFYNGGPHAQLDGAVIEECTFILGSRLPVGVYEDPVVVHLWLHTSDFLPSGNVTRTLGPLDVAIHTGTDQTEIVLPVEWAQEIVDNGGGIAITGDHLAGFMSRVQQPTSGMLTLSWAFEE